MQDGHEPTHYDCDHYSAGLVDYWRDLQQIQVDEARL